MAEEILCSKKLTISEVKRILTSVWKRSNQNSLKQQLVEDDSDGEKIKTDSQIALTPETKKITKRIF